LIPPDWQEVARSIHSSGRQIVIAVTGGGSGAVAALLQTPGASRTVLEAVVPYSLAALTQWVRGKPDQACSEATARAMAMAAFERARQLAPEAEPRTWLGVAATASLATDRPKRGERRVHLAYQTYDRTWSGYSSLDDLPANRADDERASGELALKAVAKACGTCGPSSELFSAIGRDVLAPSEQIELLLGNARRIVLKTSSDANYFAESAAPPISLLFPGAFNPLHAGHLRMAEIAESKARAAVTWELSITNVDKPPLDYMTIAERVEALRSADPHRLFALTRAPTFQEKAELFPGAMFVVGVDTIVRIGEPRYYGGDPLRRDEAIEAITNRGCRFLVFGREVGGRFATLGDLTLPEELSRLCEEVPAVEFREDISSTELRQQAGDT
jgi:hypothetical protein